MLYAALNRRGVGDSDVIAVSANGTAFDALTATIGPFLLECLCVPASDPFVMNAWAEKLGAQGKIKLLADTRLGLFICSL
jgi:hypothetical protein